jgi:hypothetical protein
LADGGLVRRPKIGSGHEVRFRGGFGPHLPDGTLAAKVPPGRRDLLSGPDTFGARSGHL